MVLGTAILTAYLACLPYAEGRASGSNVAPRQSSGTAQVSLNNNTGATNHLASGIIFGVPDDDSQIPDNMYTDWGFNFLRAGGAQLPSPRGGWIYGETEYENRMQQVLGNYRSAQRFGAKFIFLHENLYGQWDPVNDPYPGDNDDWTEWDAMTDRIIVDMQAAGVSLDDFIVEIINESDGPWYWQRPQSQAFEMWRRTYVDLRQAFGSAVKIQGPSTSSEPNLNNDWWTAFAQFVRDNDCIPDTWTWHMELGGSSNMLDATAGFYDVLNEYGLPINDININEYATAYEQVPAGGAWWIAQLERHNIPGLRGNWLSYPGLYDYLSNLVSKPGAPDASPTASGYFPVGEYQVYKYYAQSMTGHRVGTLPSSDKLLDVYATVDPDARAVKILGGIRRQTGTWTIEVGPLSALGLAPSGNLNLRCLEFFNNGLWGEVDAPADLGTSTYTYSNDYLEISYIQNDTEAAYAFEFTY